MKLNKIASAIVLTMGMVGFGAQADQGSGSVTFTGAIIDAPCSINPEDVNQTVELGSIAKAALKASGKSTPRLFDIRLENCAIGDAGTGGSSRADVANTVSITFNGPGTDNTNTLLALNDSSVAQGAGVGITGPDGKPVVLGKASSPVTLMDAATNTLHMYGYVQGLGVDKDLQEGEFQAVTDFTLDYQ